MMPAIFQRWATSVRQPLIAVTFIVALYLIAIAHAQSPATQPQDGASIQQHIAELKAQSDALPLNDPRHGDFAVQILDLKQTLKKLQSSDAQPSTQPSGVVDRQTLETRLADLDKSQTAIKSQIDALNQSINAAQSDVAMYKESANKYAVGRLANAEAGIPAGADTNVANGSRETGKAIAAQRKLDALSRQLGALNATNARDDELRQRLQSQLDNLSDPVTSAQIAEYRQKRLDEIDKMERKGTERSMAARGPGKHFDVASYASAQRLEIAQESDWKIAAEIRDARKNVQNNDVSTEQTRRPSTQPARRSAAALERYLVRHKRFIYRFAADPPRLMELLPDGKFGAGPGGGTVGGGPDSFEQRWRTTDGGIIISGAHGDYTLIRDADGSFNGRISDLGFDVVLTPEPSTTAAPQTSETNVQSSSGNQGELMVTCPGCSGTGKLSGDAYDRWLSAETTANFGSGRMRKLTVPSCPTCHGTGKIPAPSPHP